MRNPATPYHERRVLPLATLTSIATVIGSGILALPVTLHATALPLFLLLFTVSAIAQVAVVYAIVELLHRARAEAAAAPPPPAAAAAAQQHPSYSAVPAAAAAAASVRDDPVSLYHLAARFLPSAPLRALYYASTFGCFAAILVSYGLAGPQAVWQLLSAAGHSTAPPPSALVLYAVVGLAAVIGFLDPLLPLFGSLTVVKGALFIAVVAIVAALPPAAKVASLSQLMADSSTWHTAAAAPFLMSCVALGGLANTTPVTFNLLPPNPTNQQVARYRAAVLLAVLVCYLLNVGWVMAVLQVVPRHAPPGEPSLALAYEHGQISTIPLINALHNGNAVHGAVLRAVAIIVELFIFVSTGVSFFVTAAGMKSFVDGAAAVVPNAFPVFDRPPWRRLPNAVAYVLAFGSVLYVIVANPDGFIAVLTRFVSFNVNLQAGALLFLMLYNSRGMTGFFEENDPQGEDSAAAENRVSTCLEFRQDLEANEGRKDVLIMSNRMASVIILFGSVFFLFACAIAAFGPLFGIDLSAPRE